MMKKRNLVVEELDDLVPPGFNINQGEKGSTKYCFVDLVYRAMAIQKFREELSEKPPVKSSNKRSSNGSV